MAVGGLTFECNCDFLDARAPQSWITSDEV